MEKRKPRKKLAKEPEFKNKFKPFDFTKIGTSDDPCFGKHYDAKAPECNACGDSEICIIALSQQLNLKRTAEEGKQVFKDIESDIPEEKDPMLVIPKLIKRYVAKEYTLKKSLRLIRKKLPEADYDEAWVKRLYKNHKE